MKQSNPQGEARLSLQNRKDMSARPAADCSNSPLYARVSPILKVRRMDEVK